MHGTISQLGNKPWAVRA